MSKYEHIEPYINKWNIDLKMLEVELKQTRQDAEEEFMFKGAMNSVTMSNFFEGIYDF